MYTDDDEGKIEDLLDKAGEAIDKEDWDTAETALNQAEDLLHDQEVKDA